MKSRTSKTFRDRYRRLPLEVRKQARRAYRQWLYDPYQSGLQFKRIYAARPIYSVRIGLHWRALGVLEDDTIIWSWIGSHAEYDRLLNGR